MAEVGYFLNKRDRRNFLDMMRQRSRLRSGPLQRRSRKPRGSTISSDASSDEIFGLLIKDIEKYEMTVLGITPGFAEKAVLVLEELQDDLGFIYFDSPLVEQLAAASEEEVIDYFAEALDAFNPVWPMTITAGLGNYQNSSEAGETGVWTVPVIVRGHLVETRRQSGSESESGGATRTGMSFVITDVFLPITLVYGYTTTAVDGGDFDIVGVTKLWGRDPQLESSEDSGSGDKLHVQNPDGWTSDDMAYCVAMQLEDGLFYALDLRCKEEGTT